MTGLELNKKIKDICDYGSGVTFDAFGGKPIPYIGWFWRSFDFDRFDRWFGVIPADENEEGNIPLAGFMVDDKWGYCSVQATEKEWENIRRLLEIAVENPIDGTLKLVNEAIQDLLKDGRTMKMEFDEDFEPYLFQVGIHSEDGKVVTLEDSGRFCPVVRAITPHGIVNTHYSAWKIVPLEFEGPEFKRGSEYEFKQ